MKARHVIALRWCIRQSEAWRENLTDPTTLEHFDAMVTDAKEALREISKPRHADEARGNR